MHSRRTAPQLREAVHDDVRPLRSGLTGQRSQARVDRGRGEILLYGEIGPSEWGMVDAEAFARILKDLGDVTVIDLRINSYGGFADEGIAIYSQLVRHPAQVNVTVDGIAASIASVIAMAGKTIRMNRGTRMMVHEAAGLGLGGKRAMRKAADVLEAYDQAIVDIYAHRTGRSRAELMGLMEAETWLSAKDAVDKGFADGVDEQAAAVENRLSPMAAALFKRAPKDLLGRRRETVPRMRARMQIVSMRQRLAARAPFDAKAPLRRH